MERQYKLSEAKRAYYRAWRAAHPSYQKKYNDKYVRENKEDRVQRAVAWIRANPEKKKASDRKYSKTHRAQKNRQLRQWRAINRERSTMIDRRRRAVEMGAVGSHTLEEWENIKLLYDNRCWKCGTTGKLTEDHIIPLSKGGANSIDNIAPLCHSCNSAKKDKTLFPYCILVA